MLRYIIILLFFSKTALTQTIISNELFHNVYIGIDNPISIGSYGKNFTQLSLSVDVGEIIKVAKGRYSWKVCSANKRYAFLKVFNKNKLIDSIYFRLLQLPNPKITTRNQDGQIVFKNIPCVGVRADIENFIVEGIAVSIQQFTVSITKSNGDSLSVINQGDSYTDEQLKIFSELKKGDRIILRDFVVLVGCDDKLRTLNTEIVSVYTDKEYELRY